MNIFNCLLVTFPTFFNQVENTTNNTSDNSNKKRSYPY